MEKNSMITERFKKLDCPESEKKILHKYLMACLAEGKTFCLKRSRVMIVEYETKNKFIILDIVRTDDENKQFYMCPKCSDLNFSEFLTSAVPSSAFKSCLHSELCKLVWGDTFEHNLDVEDDDETDLVEVITEEPRYLAVIHPSNKYDKGPGVVTLTSKTLKPKCCVCPGQNRCVHLTIHLEQYKRGVEGDSTRDKDSKRIRMERVQPKNPQKKSIIDPDVLDPFQHDGPEANVFNIKIDFIQTKLKVAKNRATLGKDHPFLKKFHYEICSWRHVL